MDYAKQMRLVRKLSELTDQDAIDWKQAVPEGLFQVSFRDNSVRIMLQSANAAPDIIIQLVNGDGEVVESFSDVNLQEASDDAQPGEWYNFLMSLYNAARRKALGADRVLNEIINDLDEIIPF